MSRDSRRECADRHNGGLVLLTGPSHAGKTSAARQILDEIPGPVGYLAIDEIISNLRLGPRDHWEYGLPVAYEIALASVKALLQRRFLVIVESTFTYVPGGGKGPQFHAAHLDRFAQIAEGSSAHCVIVRLTTALGELRRRRSHTVRLTPRVIEGTWQLHSDQALDRYPLIEVDTTAETHETTARRLHEILTSHFALSPA